MSIFDKWNQVQPKEVSGPQKGYMVLNKSRTQILSSPNGRMHSRETPYCCGKDYYLNESLDLWSSFRFFSKLAYWFIPGLDEINDHLENYSFVEIVALDKILLCDKFGATNHFCIVKELSEKELKLFANISNSSTGIMNIGNFNKGDGNIGDCNYGSYNIQDSNFGHMNNGNNNVGNQNSGWRNIGDENTGNRNTGDCNSGGGNIGNYNSGGDNNGHGNSGFYNIGNNNSGDWNKTSFSSGVFCTEQPCIMIFNKPSSLTLQQWRDSHAFRILQSMPGNGTRVIDEKYVDSKEKAEHPECEVTGCIMKSKRYSVADRINWWNHTLTPKEREVVHSIPNFDPDIFEEITGIPV